MQIFGSLSILSGTQLRARSIYVAESGTLKIGSAESPATNVRVHLEHSDCEVVADVQKADCLRDGQLVSLGTLLVHGAPKTPWSTLAVTAPAGSASIVVEECDGWVVGDRLVVAPTGGEALSYTAVINYGDPSPLANYEAEERAIAAVSENLSGCTVTLDAPLAHRHRGEMVHGVVPIHAEVANLDRSIVFTGPPLHWREVEKPIRGGQGITTVQAGGGLMVMEWARVERCGRVALGQYCVHLHLVGKCASCAVRGVVVDGGVNKGITIHGTHDATVEENVVYDLRGASIYVEDGNEVGNLVKKNALICPSFGGGGLGGVANDGSGRVLQRCVCDCVPEHADSDKNEQAAIYVLSPSNDFVGNRVCGHENAFFSNHQGGRNWGIGAANGKVCLLSSPFGRFEGNVFHNNAGFGWYVNVAFTTAVAAAADSGFVDDWSTCLPYNMTSGADLAAPITVSNHVEYFNDFSMGAYDLGDVSFVDTVSAFNNKGLYWKSYRRGAAAGPLALRTTFHDNGMQIQGPGGSAAVELRGATFSWSATDAASQPVQLNHHCGLDLEPTGGLCASHYDFADSTFSVPPNFIDDTAAHRSDVVVLYNGTVRVLLTANRAFDGAGCTSEDPWLVCPAAMGLRIVRIYSPDRGTMVVTADGVGYEVGYRPVPKWSGHAKLPYVPGSAYIHPTGYTFVVKDGATVELSLRTDLSQSASERSDMFVVEYSDPPLPPTSITLSVTGVDSALQGGACAVASTHSRSFITPYGPLVPQAGAWWECTGGWPTRYDQAAFLADFGSLIASNVQVKACALFPEAACEEIYDPWATVVHDTVCGDVGGVGCWAGGVRCCRRCDAEGLNTCADRDVAWEETT